VDELRCVTIRQPWASAIALGAKLVENRTRSTSYRGLIGIHAGKAWAPGGVHDERVQRAILGMLCGMDPGEAWARFGSLHLPAGSVIAVANLVDCHRAGAAPCCGQWGDPECWHMVLANVRRLPMPVPAKGSLALPWVAPEDVAARVMGQMVEVTA
jgi:hypothetical protein